jgi:hypothetical protein
MNPGTKVTVYLVTPTPSDPRPSLRGRLVYAYMGEGPVFLRVGKDQRIVPAEQVKYVESNEPERDDDVPITPWRAGW